MLLHLKKVHGPANFFRFIDNRPEAISLFQLWAKDNAIELLRDFNYQDDRRTDSALMVLSEAYATKVIFVCRRRCPCASPLITMLQDVKTQTSKIRAAGKFFSEDSERSFESRVSMSEGT